MSSRCDGVKSFNKSRGSAKSSQVLPSFISVRMSPAHKRTARHHLHRTIPHHSECAKKNWKISIEQYYQIYNGNLTVHRLTTGIIEFSELRTREYALISANAKKWWIRARRLNFANNHRLGFDACSVRSSCYSRMGKFGLPSPFPYTGYRRPF